MLVDLSAGIQQKKNLGNFETKAINKTAKAIFDDLPEANKKVMIKLADLVIKYLKKEVR